MPIYQLPQRHPNIASSSWIAPTANVIGSVTLAENVSVWWNTVIRGDTEAIYIGANSNVQDNCVLHADPGVPLTVGEFVSIGHMAMLHGCTIGNGSLIGIKSVIMNNAVIGENCLIAANTLISEGKTIPPRSLVVGSPGRILRTLTDEEVERLHATALHYVENATLYRDSLTLSK